MGCAKRLGWGLEMHTELFGSSLGDPNLSTVGSQLWIVLGPRVVPDQVISPGNPHSGVESPLEADAFPGVLNAAATLGSLLLYSCCYLSLH